MNRIAYYLFLFQFIAGNAFSQASFPYKLSTKLDIPLFFSAALNASASHYHAWKKEGLTLNEISLLDRSTVNGFDRWAIGKNSSAAGKTSDYVAMGSGLIIPFSFFCNPAKKTEKPLLKRALIVSAMSIEAVVLTDGLTYLFKSTTLRPRPFMFDPSIPSSSKESSEGRFSFFSGHTSFSSCATFFAAKVLCDTHPNWKIKPLIWTIASIIPAATAYFRVAAGMHFPSDVLMGYLVGAATGFLIPEIHKNPRKVKRLPGT